MFKCTHCTVCTGLFLGLPWGQNKAPFPLTPNKSFFPNSKGFFPNHIIVVHLTLLLKTKSL